MKGYVGLSLAEFIMRLSGSEIMVRRHIFMEMIGAIVVKAISLVFNGYLAGYVFLKVG